MPISPDADNVLPSVEQSTDDPPPPYTSREVVEPADNWTAPIFGVRTDTLGKLLEMQFRRARTPTAELPEDLQGIMDAALTENEASTIVTELSGLLRPGYMYWVAAKFEEVRIDRRMRPWCYKSDQPRRHVNDVFEGRLGQHRLGILVRHYIKRRWKALNIWNPKWGFPGRSNLGEDDVNTWQWPWEEPVSHGFAHSEALRNLYYQKLLKRAMAMRMNFNRHQEIPLSPFTSNEHFKPQNATEAEQWLITRPWVIFQIELAEECVRYLRLSPEQRHRHPHHPRAQVIEWWKARGDWRDKFDITIEYNYFCMVEAVGAWTWRNEYPSPEPESIKSISPYHRRPLQEIGIDFTESEVEDLETNERPENQKPPSHWSPTRDDRPFHVFRPQSFPGQTSGEEDTVAPEQPSGLFGAPVRRSGLFGDAAAARQGHGLFGSPGQPWGAFFGDAAAARQGHGLFRPPGQPQGAFGDAAAARQGHGLFGPPGQPQGAFGAGAAARQPQNVFGSPVRPSGLFGAGAAARRPQNVFGSPVRSSGLFGDGAAARQPQGAVGLVASGQPGNAIEPFVSLFGRASPPVEAPEDAHSAAPGGEGREDGEGDDGGDYDDGEDGEYLDDGEDCDGEDEGPERHDNDHSQVPQGEEIPASPSSSQGPRRRRPVARSRQPTSSGSQSSLRRSTRIAARRRPAEEELGPTAPNKRRRVPGNWSSVTVDSPSTAAPALPNCLLM